MRFISSVFIKNTPKALKFSSLFCGFSIASRVRALFRLRVVCNAVRCVR